MSQASILSTLSSMSLVHDMYKKQELGVLASKLEDLWMGVTFSHYMDVFVVPLVLTHGSGWSRSLDKLLFSEDLIALEALKTFHDLRNKTETRRLFGFDDGPMVIALANLREKYIYNPTMENLYTTTVIFDLSVAWTRIADKQYRICGKTTKSQVR